MNQEEDIKNLNWLNVIQMFTNLYLNKIQNQKIIFLEKVLIILKMNKLTWRERKILEWQNDQVIREIVLPQEIQEGWGITHNPEQPNIFYISDGSNNIYLADRNQNFKVIKKFSVFQKDYVQQQTS